MALTKYQANAIKEIHGDDLISNSNSISEIEHYYENNSNYNNVIESPDLLTMYSSYHGLTPKPLTSKRLDTLNEDIINRIGIAQYIYDRYISYFKVLNEKDLDWENSYLKYTYNQLDLSTSQDYVELNTVYDEANNKVNLIATEKNTGDEFKFVRGLTPNINNTYDLLNTIDYLLNKIRFLYFMYNVIKNQYINVSNYRERLSEINTNNN